MDEVRERLRRVLEVEGYIDEDGAWAYFEGAREVVRELEALIASRPREVVRLAEYAVELLEAADVDDDGGLVDDVLERVQVVHFDACAAGEPDPVELAESLVALALASENGVFLTVLPDYGQILGRAGLDRYRELLDQAAGQPQSAQRRFAIDRMVELAAATSVY
ncbi:hypothetical protein [Actinokineospora diospyrosa]|uniref:hypothetical protein n=1 Tax=Actinokineospora diospyrosa TaxID=103728 RepID=UPI0020A3EFE1|nr:hypothetical protein [Actinokineospora diospyrosa]